MDKLLKKTIGKLKWFSDPSHGWLRVPKGLVIESGIEVSEFSYESARYLYLEEDCDANKFLMRIGYSELEQGQIPYVNSIDKPSHVRNYPRYVNPNSPLTPFFTKG